MDGHENDADALNQPSATPENTTPAETSTAPANETSANETPTNETSTSGAIFSGNDTRIETENLPETVHQTALSTAPAGAITPALRTESTVTEDLKLDNTGSRKKKKWPLVAVGVVVLAIIAAGILAWVNFTKPDRDLASLQTKFNQFANYFLYETDNSSPVEGYYDYGDLYWLAQEGNESNYDERISQHFTQAEEKFRAFYEQYEKYIAKYPDKIADETKDLVNAYLEQLEMFHYTMLYRDLSLDSILSAYFEMPDELPEAVSKYYEPFESAKTELVKNYGAEKARLAADLLNAFTIYESLGCMNHDTEEIATECLTNTEDEQLSIANRDYELFRAKLIEQSMSGEDVSIRPYQSIWKISWGIGQ